MGAVILSYSNISNLMTGVVSLLEAAGIYGLLLNKNAPSLETLSHEKVRKRLVCFCFYKCSQSLSVAMEEQARLPSLPFPQRNVGTEFTGDATPRSVKMRLGKRGCDGAGGRRKDPLGGGAPS